MANIPISATLRQALEKAIRKAGFLGNFHTIDGKEVCEFLDLHPGIRRSFPQLIGLADIEQVINRDIYNRSSAFLAEWQPKLTVFVAVKSYFKALDVIGRHHFAVLDGPPEAGKSIIGAATTLVYACEGYEVLHIRDPQDFFRAFDAARKQVFFADDAIGSISFNPSLGDRWSGDLPGILRKLGPDHKLIWTARSYILNEAIKETKLREHLDDFPGVHEVIVEVSEFTIVEKSMILYNHAKNSTLVKAGRDLIKSHAVHIVQRESFTPERARQIVNLVLTEITGSLTANEQRVWFKRIMSHLDNPGERFRRAYEVLGPSEKALLLALLDTGETPSKEELKLSYEKRLSAV